MTPQLRKLGKGMPVIIALLYFLHLELVFSLLPLSMMGMILIGCTIAFLLYTRLFPHCGSSILALFLLLFFLWTIVALPSLWHILYNATLDTYRANSTLTFYPFSVSWDPQRELLLLSGLLSGLFLFLSALFDCLLRICRWPRAAAFLLVVLLIPCVLHHVPQPFTILPLIALLFGLFFANRSFQRPFRLYTLFSAFLVLMLILRTASMSGRSTFRSMQGHRHITCALTAGPSTRTTSGPSCRHSATIPWTRITAPSCCNCRLTMNACCDIGTIHRHSTIPSTSRIFAAATSGSSLIISASSRMNRRRSTTAICAKMTTMPGMLTGCGKRTSTPAMSGKTTHCRTHWMAMRVSS